MYIDTENTGSLFSDIYLLISVKSKDIRFYMSDIDYYYLLYYFCTENWLKSSKTFSF